MGPALTVLGASLAAGIVAASPTAALGGGKPKPKSLACLSECAGPRAAAVGGRIRLAGERLGHVSEVRFAGESAPVAAAPDRADPRKVVVTVPAGAVSGRVRLLKPSGEKGASRERLRVVAPTQVADGFELANSNVRPNRAFFDQSKPIELSYRFEAPARTGVRVEVVRARDKKTIRTYRKPHRLPFQPHEQRWNALEGDGDAANDGAYRFRLGEFGERDYAAGQVKLYGYRFPVRGSHGYGGAGERFGAPRGGGRVHQGQDVFAGCGTKLEAARGGRVQAKAYDPGLYGHYVVIDARKTEADHMYVHLASPARPARGDRVHTGERIGSVGRSGNARAEPCQLHFEIWPHGWRDGAPVDPLPALKRWDGWS